MPNPAPENRLFGPVTPRKKEMPMLRSGNAGSAIPATHALALGHAVRLWGSKAIPDAPLLLAWQRDSQVNGSDRIDSRTSTSLTAVNRLASILSGT